MLVIGPVAVVIVYGPGASIALVMILVATALVVVLVVLRATVEATLVVVGVTRLVNSALVIG